MKLHMFTTLVHSDQQSTSIFGQKLTIRTSHHTFLESRDPEVIKNLHYVLSTGLSQIFIFYAPAHVNEWMKLYLKNG